ncbi:MAG: preprotein translocase subunit SecA [Phycisphaeraceae bacterium]
MVINNLSRAFTKVFGSRNERLVKSYRSRVEQINAFEPEMRKLTDAELYAKTREFRDRHANGESRRQFLPEAMAVGREVMDRAVGIRNILDPAQGFEPGWLPERARPIYERVRAEADALAPVEVKGGEPVPGWMQVEIPVELYEAVREIQPESRPPFRARPFDVQLIGGMVLAEGKIAEMKTGEGKTIVAPLACYLAAIEGHQCHVITVNDYLVQRDRDWVFPFYHWLGLTVGAIHPYHMQPPQKKAESYTCDVLYGTNSEFGFDYLRDNMKLSTREQVQKKRDFCIVDEIDSILIDEARTPLIISGPAHDDAPRYDLADKIARHLMELQKPWSRADEQVQQCQRRIKGLEGDIRNARDKQQAGQMREQMKQLEQELPRLEDARDQHTQYYELELDKKAAHLTHHGVAEAQKQAGIGSFYVGANMDFPHLLENALRAHAVYQRDKDYVVQQGEVVIVDENTGRLMIGRQWSDGLHQAVEAKENVKIKQETQTLATVTLQNFFKLYKRLAGMTGTAITEATEFHDIYKLEVVCIPTNVSVIRHDRNDLIYLSAKDKWSAILDEIKRMHDIGRPVLVGTTSVERSEMLSQMLTKRHGVKHEVLNAKQHEREAQIIKSAGSLGAVVIATNMAGRGTDIKLGPIDRAELVRHWQQRNILPAKASAEMGDEELVNLAYRHQAQHELGLKKADAEAMSDDEAKLRLFRHWVARDAWLDEAKAQNMSLEQCAATLDTLPDERRHRLAIWTHLEQMGGLHIVGTERHESRRIDNQLRGRSGRQGDRGSSRFFISLEDDLMKMFAGRATLTALSKLGMKEGDAIEHRWVTKSVERAQRKVEERNFQSRKQLLDFDEVMEYQRNTFYSLRQEALEGRDVSQLIFDYIEDAVTDAVHTYKGDDYVPSEVVEWVRHTLDASVDPARLRLDDARDLEQSVRRLAEQDIQQTVEVTIGEYMSNDTPAEDWDFEGLAQWAMSRFSVDLKLNQLRQMNIDEVKEKLSAAALAQFQAKDLSELGKFVERHYGERELAQWAKTKFSLELDPEELGELTVEQATEQILSQARQAYRRREITYPADFVMDFASQLVQQDREASVNQLITWARQRYELEWTPEYVLSKKGRELHEQLVEAGEQWLEKGRLEGVAREKAAAFADDPKGLAAWLRQRFGMELTPDEVAEADDREALIIAKGRQALRTELSQLERFVVLQILDQAWKDHLYAMDQLKDAVNLRGYAQQDPRIEYKREGANQFAEMQEKVRDRVTELIFRARLTPNVQARNVYGQQQQARHEQQASTGVRGGAGAAGGPAPGQGQPVAGAGQGVGAAAGAAAAGTAEQQADQEAAERAGGGPARHMTRKQRRAAEARERKGTTAKGAKTRKKKSR